MSTHDPISADRRMIRAPAQREFLASAGRDPRGPAARRGFTFLEVLFAVIIIGVGFIMIAAMFPVAIQQGQATLDESVGATVARNAAKYLESVATSNLLVQTSGQVMTLPTAVTSNQLATGDRRFAWVGFYKRDNVGGNPLPYAQVWTLACRAQLEGQATYAAPPPVPAQLTADLAYGAAGSTITFTGSAGQDAPNAFAIVANASKPNMIGRILRLGTATTVASQWYLQQDLASDSSENVTGATIFLVGAPQVPASSPAAYAGGAQDVAAFTSFIRLNN